MTRAKLKLLGVVLGAISIAGATSLAPLEEACAQQAPVSYADDVAPIFKGRCVSCHQPGGEGYTKSGLDLTSYEGLMKGTKFGPMVIPGEPDASSLMALIDWRAAPELRMPHGKKKLSSCDRDAIWSWIRQGAKNN